MFNKVLFKTSRDNWLSRYKNRYGNLLQYDVEEDLALSKEFRVSLAPFVIDAVEFMRGAQENQAKNLVEGGQALMLDIEFGTYPYVTSSSTGLGGIVTGLALRQRHT